MEKITIEPSQIESIQQNIGPSVWICYGKYQINPIKISYVIIFNVITHLVSMNVICVVFFFFFFFGFCMPGCDGRGTNQQ